MLRFKRKGFTLLLLGMMVLGIWGCESKQESIGVEETRQLIIATGSPYELRLVDALAKPFEAKYGCTVRCVKTPTGPGLDLGRHGRVDITMGHSHTATDKFEKEGHAAFRSQSMHNYTVIVGPLDDSVGISRVASLQDPYKRLKEAQRMIYERKALYLSRGDEGGMDLLEKRVWQELGLEPIGQPWYKESKKFMLASLREANQENRYHMLDSSTWIKYRSEMANLKLLLTVTPNEYEICVVSPRKHPYISYNHELAKDFFNFVTGSEGQKIIAAFGKEEYGEALYFPDVINVKRR
jgi:tungstate transport system substrate-binding protein